MWRHKTFGLIFGAAAFLALAAGCDGGETGAAAKSQRPPAATTQPTAAEIAAARKLTRDSAARGAPDLPQGHPPIGDISAAQPAETAPIPRTGPPESLKYKAPDAWQKEPVRFAMRADQYRLPRAEGDNEDGELAVFPTGIRGGVEGNIARWRAQFTTADGQPIPDSALLRETLEVNGLRVTVVDITGRFGGAMAMPGAPEAQPKDNWRLLGAIVETPSGPWFFKATGPAATMAKHRDAFMELVRSITTE